ncbi:MAG: DMT family transporter [Caulobacteraceae bacterium]|nr:DMT family transporter [Caulobacter sp.]
MIWAFLAVLVAGACAALEAPSNAYVTKVAGSPLWGGLAAALTGLAAVLVALAVARPRLAPDWLSAPPAYVWLGGVYGALLVVLSAWGTRKLGAGAALVVMVAAQVGLGIVLDHFGLIGLKTHPASWLRIAGAAVVIAGAVMVSVG